MQLSNQQSPRKGAAFKGIKMIFYHEFTFNGFTDLLIGTEDAIDRLLKFYVNDDYKLVTLWLVKDLPLDKLSKYRQVRIIN